MNFVYSFGCYLMSLMLLNAFVLGKICDFLNLSIFYNILVNNLFILSKCRSISPPYEDELILWPIVLTESFLAFGTTSFHTKFSDFCA